jgi:hypothetical protein
VRPDVLSRRALGRATLARQLLLERASLAPLDAVHHLVGLQAQVPRDPYLALWSRLAAFDPDATGRLVEDRALVRITAMRATIHLLTADDCLLLRPLCQPVLDGELRRHPEHAPHLRDVELAPVLARARELLAERPMTPAALGRALSGTFPDHDGSAMAYACRNMLALVQVPPRGVWRRRGQVTVATAETWLGRPLVAAPAIEDVVARYLAAFGPALPADVAAWSRLTGFRKILDRMGSRLRTYTDDRGRQLVDVPGAPLPDPDTPAPVRFLPEYDNALLSHSDRSRYTPDDIAALATDDRVHGTALVDGSIAATWSTRTDDAGRVTMTVRHLPRLGARDRTALGAEAELALHFLEPDAPGREVRVVAAGQGRP